MILSPRFPLAQPLGHTMQRGHQLCQFKMKRLNCNMLGARDILLAVRTRIGYLPPQSPTHIALVRSAVMTAVCNVVSRAGGHAVDYIVANGVPTWAAAVVSAAYRLPFNKATTILSHPRYVNQCKNDNAI